MFQGYLRLPYPTDNTMKIGDEEYQVKGQLVEITDDGETRTYRIILESGHEMISTSKSEGILMETVVDEDGVTWAKTVDTGPGLW